MANFNSRSREGSDTCHSEYILRRKNFNSRSREGSDINVFNTLFELNYFNSRSREGSDQSIGEQPVYSRFQFTLP